MARGPPRPHVTSVRQQWEVLNLPPFPGGGSQGLLIETTWCHHCSSTLEICHVFFHRRPTVGRNGSFMQLECYLIHYPQYLQIVSSCRHTQHCLLEKWQHPGGQMIPSICFSDLYSFCISTTPLNLTSVSISADIVLCGHRLNKMSAGDNSCFIGAAL